MECSLALRRRAEESQGELWIATGSIAKAPGHVFYERLNAILRDAGFDRFVEELVAPSYADKGRPGIPPGVYFRMLFVGYFEGIESQRGIAWRCEDSLSLRKKIRNAWDTVKRKHRLRVARKFTNREWNCCCGDHSENRGPDGKCIDSKRVFEFGKR